MFGTVAEPTSVLMAGFLCRARWKPVLAAYAIMLVAYFAHPFGRAFPVWTILDVLFAVILIYPAARFSNNLFRKDMKRLAAALLMISFVCIATDSLVRVFLLVPCGLHGLFFESYDVLYAVFVGAAIDSFIEDLIVVLVSLIAGSPLVLSILKLKVFGNSWNMRKSPRENGDKP